MFEEITTQFKKNAEQFQENLKNPQEFISKFQTANKALTDEMKESITAAPALIQEYFQVQQKNIQDLNAKVVESFNKQPVDFLKFNQAILEYTKNNFTFHVEKTKENIEKFQKSFQKNINQ